VGTVVVVVVVVEVDRFDIVYTGVWVEVEVRGV